MHIKFICISLVTFALLHDVNGKKTKKKRISLETTESPAQPNVVTYSTFGFKDVGAYDGFVPSSPDYASFLTSNSRDSSSTRLYAPAFPSSIDSTGLGSYYDPQPDAASHTVTSDGYETHVKSYQPVSMNFFTSPNYDTNGDQNKNAGTKEVYELNNNYNNNSPTYGTKISSKSKNKNFSNVNHTDYNIYNSVSSVINGNTAIGDNVSNNNNYHILSSGQSEDEKVVKISPSLNSSPLKFPRVVDFTGVKNYYPTSVDSKFVESIHKPFNLDIFGNVAGNENLNPYENNKYNLKDQSKKEEQSNSNKWNLKDERTNYMKSVEKTISQVNSFKNEDISENYPITYNNFKNNRLKNDYKDNVKSKHVNFGLENNSINKHGNAMKGYEYSTNYSNTSFKYETGLPKRPFDSSIDEIVPAGSNLDFVDYQFPDKEYSTFKTTNIKSPYNFDADNAFSIPKNKYKLSEDYLNSFKHLFTTPSSSSNWGNIFKDSEFSSYKSHPKKPSFNDESNDDIVHIPKRPTNFDFEKYFDNKPSELSFTDSYKPYKPVRSRDQYEWPTKDSSNRYKSEEDLLGLRNHDTSHPSYVPSFKPNYKYFDEDVDYKKLAAKWKQNFLKAKLRDSIREYDSYASEPKPVHVPFPKPYPIEVPHPVVVPVPQPYPVKVPIPKPVAVPVIRELTVPVEKPMPYPVFKKVPYPIEKLVPVPVVKQVPVPVVKPYPVHIPQIRPVFHHTKSHDDREIDPDEEEYIPRPDAKRPSNKRPKNTRNRQRPLSSSKRPSRAPYNQDRSRRRIPNRRPTSYPDQRQRRPYPSELHSPQRYRDDFDEYDSDSDFERYCRRTGKC
ncbi:hybrid signal transduction histidine kinase M-like isoform X2 [Maniola hyperantus]|uniref:hybrid signal transduction histidine kinase M-like isoform X2 n=1 Tax=Aphantopus hyperantus TaxID=2795564 RepID=UPI0037482AF6